MKQRKINFIKLLKGYKNGWVAISPNFEKIVVSGKTLRETIEKAKKVNQQVYYFPVEKSYSNFIGSIH